MCRYVTEASRGDGSCDPASAGVLLQTINPRGGRRAFQLAAAARYDCVLKFNRCSASPNSPRIRDSLCVQGCGGGGGVVGRQRATLHPADDRGATCAAVTTVSGDREPLKATGADRSRISISVPESDSLRRHRLHGARVCPPASRSLCVPCACVRE